MLHCVTIVKCAIVVDTTSYNKIYVYGRNSQNNLEKSFLQLQDFVAYSIYLWYSIFEPIVITSFGTSQSALIIDTTSSNKIYKYGRNLKNLKKYFYNWKIFHPTLYSWSTTFEYTIITFFGVL